MKRNRECIRKQLLGISKFVSTAVCLEDAVDKFARLKKSLFEVATLLLQSYVDCSLEDRESSRAQISKLLFSLLRRVELDGEELESFFVTFVLPLCFGIDVELSSADRSVLIDDSTRLIQEFANDQCWELLYLLAAHACQVDFRVSGTNLKEEYGGVYLRSNQFESSLLLSPWSLRNAQYIVAGSAFFQHSKRDERRMLVDILLCSSVLDIREVLCSREHCEEWSSQSVLRISNKFWSHGVVEDFQLTAKAMLAILLPADLPAKELFATTVPPSVLEHFIICTSHADCVSCLHQLLPLHRSRRHLLGCLLQHRTDFRNILLNDLFQNIEEIVVISRSHSVGFDVFIGALRAFGVSANLCSEAERYILDFVGPHMSNDSAITLCGFSALLTASTKRYILERSRNPFLLPLRAQFEDCEVFETISHIFTTSEEKHITAILPHLNQFLYSALKILERDFEKIAHSAFVRIILHFATIRWYQGIEPLFIDSTDVRAAVISTWCLPTCSRWDVHLERGCTSTDEAERCLWGLVAALRCAVGGHESFWKCSFSAVDTFLDSCMIMRFPFTMTFFNSTLDFISKKGLAQNTSKKLHYIIDFVGPLNMMDSFHLHNKDHNAIFQFLTTELPSMLETGNFNFERCAVDVDIILSFIQSHFYVIFSYFLLQETVSQSTILSFLTLSRVSGSDLSKWHQQVKKLSKHFKDFQNVDIFGVIKKFSDIVSRNPCTFSRMKVIFAVTRLVSLGIPLTSSVWHKLVRLVVAVSDSEKIHIEVIKCFLLFSKKSASLFSRHLCEVIVTEMLDLREKIQHPSAFFVWASSFSEISNLFSSHAYFNAFSFFLFPEDCRGVPFDAQRILSAWEALPTILKNCNEKTKRLFLGGLERHLQCAGSLFDVRVKSFSEDILQRIHALCFSSATSKAAQRLLGLVGLPLNDIWQVADEHDIASTLQGALNWRFFTGHALSRWCCTALAADDCDISVHDKAAFAAQEIIKLAVAEERSDRLSSSLPITIEELQRYQWWSGLDQGDQSTLIPFASTKFLSSKIAGKSAQNTFESGMEFSLWVSLFSKAVIETVPGCIQKMLFCLRPLLLVHTNFTLSFLLTSILLSVCGSLSAHERIMSELVSLIACNERPYVAFTLSLYEMLLLAQDRLRLSLKIPKCKLPIDETSPLAHVSSFLTSFGCLRLPEVSLMHSFSTRSLRIFESLRTTLKPRVDDSSYYQRIFSSLGDPGSVRAVKLATEFRFSQSVDDYLQEGRANVAFEINEVPMIKSSAESYIKSAHAMKFWNAVLGRVIREPQNGNVELQHAANEAAWRLGEWDHISQTPVPSVALPLKSLVQGNTREVTDMINDQHNLLEKGFQLLEYGGVIPPKYQMLLWALEDIRIVAQGTVDSHILVKRFESRLSAAEAFDDFEDLFSTYEVILPLCCNKLDMSTLRRRRAEFLMRIGHFREALSLTQIVCASNCDAVMLNATILSTMGRKEDAFDFAMHAARSPLVSNSMRSSLEAFAATLGFEMKFHSEEETSRLLNAATSIDDATGDAHKALAMHFYNQIFENTSQQPKQFQQTLAQLGLLTVEAFARSLTLSPQLCIEVVPRLISVWLECSQFMESNNSNRESEKVSQKFFSRCREAISKVPLFVFILSISQLLSRLSGRVGEMAKDSSTLISRLLLSFGQPVLWQVLPITFSIQKQRAQYVRNSILSPYCAHSPECRVELERMEQLFEALTAICRAPQTLQKLSSVPQVKRLANVSAWQLLLPTATSVLPTILPHSVSFQRGTTIHSFGESLEVIASLQRPKRIVITDSLGNMCFYLMKSKDEPKKDIRMMEIATVMNSLFARHGYGRHTLSLRRYAVMALCDDCAAIEWVPHTATLRKLVEESFTVNDVGVRIVDVKSWKEQCDAGRFSKVDLLQRYIFPKAPPVFHQWFQWTFPNASRWYGARLRYTRSCAAWSMCGHVVGLGDRHGENLLISLESGEVMHVDFACLFDKGETLEVPEVARFRLTPNLIDGFGVTGVNGPYRSHCGDALRALSTNKDVVLGILETLVHDPLIEWSRRDKTDPRLLVQRCRRRLEGFVDFFGSPRDSAPLSSEGQVWSLIQHSSAIETLSQMYIWWMAWI